MALTPPVQSKSVSVDLASSLSLTFTSNNAAGNCLIVCHSCTGAAGDRVTDSRNTYGADVEDIDDGNATAIGGVSSAPNCGAGANTVQVSGAGSQAGRNLHILEYAGLAATAPFDKTANNNGFGHDLSAGPTATLSQASELVVAFGYAGGTAQSPYTSTSPLTEETDLAGGTIDSTVGDNEVSVTTGVSVAFTATGDNRWGCIVGTYKAASVAASVPFQPQYQRAPIIAQ